MEAGSDETLISRVVLSGDRHAMSTLIRRHQASVRALLRRLTAGDHALADDLAQETFLRAYRNIIKFKGEALFSSWLYRIAYNVFLTSRGKRRERPAESLLGERAQVDPSEADSMLSSRLEKAMAGLRPEECLSLTLFYANGLNPAEIAKVMDCPEGTVKTHLHRAKEKLREILQVSEVIS
jgi:RNA polymerase sigma-70 factor (ECF subfamily)